MLPPSTITRMPQKKSQSQSQSQTSSSIPIPNLPPLPSIDPLSSSNQSQSSIPIKKIHSDSQLQEWMTSDAHAIYLLFISRLANASVGAPTFVGKEKQKQKEEKLDDDDPVEKLLVLLETFKKWTLEIEPFKTPQRFGNLAFRDWGKRLEEQIHTLHVELLPPSLHPYIPELIPYLQDSFGSFVRLDYGSGHELAFAAWLCCLTRLGFATSNLTGEKDSSGDTSFEKALALRVFPSYLEVAWELQDRYGLEPAGSHGVWGLDDYHFLPYVLGAAQLSEQDVYLPSDFVSPSHNPRSSNSSSSSSTTSISPSELLFFKPQFNSRIPSLSSSSSSSSFSSSPFPNLFTSSIARIHSIKKGPFYEHSPILNDISSSVPNWRKVSGGMMKMYDAECLSKRPVVQHFIFGGLFFKWEGKNLVGGSSDGDRNQIQENSQTPDKTKASNESVLTQAPTQAPWARNQTSNSTSSAINRFTTPSDLSFNSALGPRPSTSQPWTDLSSSSGSALRSGNSGLGERLAYAPISIPGLGDRSKRGDTDQIGKGIRKETISDGGSAAALSSPFGGLPKAGSGTRKP